jgi:hypothetical protein
MKTQSQYQFDLLGWLQFEQLCERLLELDGRRA